jgi:Tol biopolymer transport system component
MNGGVGAARAPSRALTAARRLASVPCCLVSLAMLVSGCGSSTPGSSAIATTEPIVASTSTASATPTLSTPASPPRPPSRTKPAVNGKIVFYGTDDARSRNTPFMIDADGSNETALHDDGLLPGIWSPDGRRLLVAHLVADPSPLPGAETAWIRPATVNADGSGFSVLDAYPDRKMQLAPVGWSGDGSRILLQSGSEDVIKADMGLYSARSSDGADLTRIMGTSPEQNDIFLVSPDGSKILVNSSTSDNDRALFMIDVDGSGHVDLTPPGMNATNLEFYDGTAADWSPDGSAIAFAAQATLAEAGGLYLVCPKGCPPPFREPQRPTRLVPPDVGAVSAQWSPDGRRIAFSSKLRANAQVWIIQREGVGLRQLTDGAGGSSSVIPVWSPDGKQLLFQRRLANKVTLWTMNADGSGQKQLTREPLASDYIGGYAWWPAIGP